MNLKRLIPLLLLLLSGSLSAQHYLLLGTGFSRLSYKSDQLDRFTSTYNQVNAAYLVQSLKEFRGAEGINWEVGYRHVGRWTFSVLAGTQNYSKKNIAQFSNGEIRTMELQINQLLLQYRHQLLEFDDIFFEGVATFYFNRRLKMESAYTGDQGKPTVKTISGIYKSNPETAIDIGASIGIDLDPVLLTGKILLPLYTGGKSDFLMDDNADKQTAGTAAFPADYEQFVRSSHYPAVNSHIDGWKILMNIDLAISFTKKAEKK